MIHRQFSYKLPPERPGEPFPSLRLGRNKRSPGVAPPGARGHTAALTPAAAPFRPRRWPLPSRRPHSIRSSPHTPPSHDTTLNMHQSLLHLGRDPDSADLALPCLLSSLSCTFSLANWPPVAPSVGSGSLPPPQPRQGLYTHLYPLIISGPQCLRACRSPNVTATSRRSFQTTFVQHGAQLVPFAGVFPICLDRMTHFLACWLPPAFPLPGKLLKAETRPATVPPLPPPCLRPRASHSLGHSRLSQ